MALTKIAADLLYLTFIAEAVEHHPHLLARQRAGYAQSNTAGRAGYNCCLACQHKRASHCAALHANMPETVLELPSDAIGGELSARRGEA